MIRTFFFVHNGDADEGGASIEEYLPIIEYAALNPGYGIYTAYYKNDDNNNIAHRNTTFHDH